MCYRHTYRQTDIQTDILTYRPSDEAGPRGAFAPKENNQVGAIRPGKRRVGRHDKESDEDLNV